MSTTPKDPPPAPAIDPRALVDLGFGADPEPMPAAPPVAVASPEPDPEPVTEVLVKDLLRAKTLGERLPLGVRTLRRVGDRAWERPNVCFSAKLFARMGAVDPWDPNEGKKAASPIGLGSVDLKLGDKRRQPAPHLRPKTPKGKKSPTAPDKPVDPVARFRNLPPSSAPASRPPAPPPPPPRPTSTLSGEFGGRAGPRPLLEKLPVRPDLKISPDGAPTPTKAPPRAAPDRRAPAPRRPDPKSRAPAPSKSSSPPKASTADGPRKPVALPRPVLPGPPGPRGGGRTSRGGSNRFRMKPTEARSPVVKEQSRILEIIDDQPASAAPAPPPALNRSAPKGPMGLDDLFGGGEGFTRMRVRRGKKKPEGGEG